MDTLTLKLRGMSCASCASSVEAAISSVAGVIDCSVNFGAEQATVKYNSQKTTLEQIQAAVDAAGYAAYPLQEEELLTGVDDTEKAARQAELQQLQRQLILGGTVSAFLVVGGLPMMTGLHLPIIPAWMHHPWLQLVLATPIQFWSGESFYQGAIKAFKRRAATMDMLVALGTSAAYFYSLFPTFLPGWFRTQGLEPAVYY